ncbi:MAG: hypothetical protein GX555_11565 [Actinomycetales bacterium]|nr:hypothetical protein [Actinomycetales bacterium]
MSEHDVTRLLGRVAAHTPHLDVDVSGVVDVGRRRVRRRRLTAGGATATVLVAALWLGQGPGRLGDQEVSPASVTWEVEEETTVDVLERINAERGRWTQPAMEEIRSLSVTKGPQGSSATYVVDGVEQTVEGETMAGGADLFVGEGVTVVLWRTAPGAKRDVNLVPYVSETSSEMTGSLEIDGADLSYWITVGASNYRPEEIIFHNGHQVWTASGQVATTVQLRDGDAEVTGFDLPQVPMIGIVDGETLGGVGQSARRAEDYTVARVPSEAVFARQVRMGQTQVGQEREVVDVGPAVPTEELPSADLVLFDWEGDDYSDVQWSADAITWHAQNQDDAAETTVQPGPVDPGGMVRLLDETYVVALDQHDWPELRKEDGSVFLSVSDEKGVIADGGAVMWREDWWPWSPRNYVYFAVGEERLPPVADGAELQDVVTVSGPAGVVTLGAVPARDG